MFDLIVCQGRVGDRAPRMIEGAASTARALEERYGVKGRSVGQPAPPAKDDWSVSLRQASETLAEVERAISESVEGGGLTVMCSNTCSASLASLPVVAREHPDAVVLWIDGHGDFNTPGTTETGYLGGMVVSGACGLWRSGHGAGLRPEHVVLVGARDIDLAERELLRTAGVRVIGPAEVTGESIARAVNGSRVWVHIDWDALEPGYVPADYEVPDGLVPAQIREIFAALPPERVLGIELAEFNASLDDEVNEKALSLILDMVAPTLDARAR